MAMIGKTTGRVNKQSISTKYNADSVIPTTKQLKHQKA